MLEAEVAFCQDLQPLLSTMENLTKRAATAVLEHGAKDLALVSKFYEHNIEVIKSSSTSLKFFVNNYYLKINRIL